MADITAILTVYRRPHLLARQVAALRAQTDPPQAIWIWANEPGAAEQAALAEVAVERVVTCTPQAHFHGRFACGLLARSEWLAVFDDDTLPGREWLANCLATFRITPGILGTAGVRLHGPSYAERSMQGWQRPTDETIEVDLVGQAWFLPVRWLTHLFQEPAINGRNGEDIELAARAWRRAGIRSYCPPHPRGEPERWGSLEGLALGVDEVASSLRPEHLAEREAVVQAELAAGWQPLFLRAPKVLATKARADATTSEKPCTPTPARIGTTQRLRLRRPCTSSLNQVRAPSADWSEQVVLDPDRDLLPWQDSRLEELDLGDLLEHVRDPLTLLRRGAARLAPGGQLHFTVANARAADSIAGLLNGAWGSADDASPVRHFTRRESEKLLFRAGLAPQLLRPLPDAAWRQWDAAGRGRQVRWDGLQLELHDDGTAEEFYTSGYGVSAAPAPAENYGLTSIVLVTYNQWAYTRQCLESIRHLTDEPYELIVVDNASTDGTPDYLRNCEDVQLIANDSNRGFPAAANQGLRAARGQQLLLLNNDAVVTTGWLRRMLRALGDNPQLGLVGPCSNAVSGPQEVPVDYPDLTQLDGWAWEWSRRNDGSLEMTDRLVGFCLLIRRKLLDAIGLLDERFGLGNFEDDDYCRRALAAGFQLAIARDAFIHHFGHRSFLGAGVDLNALLSHNAELYARKWHTSGAQSQSIAPSTHPATVAGVASSNPPDAATAPCRLSLCMIVRDNARTIRACLESIRPWVDEMVVVDTGSTDETPAICAELGARVFHLPWPDSFAAARNESLRHARGEWLFWMDSDDVIDATNGRGLRQLADAEHPPHILGHIVQVHCPGQSNAPHDVTAVHHCKLIRNRPDLQFEGRVHEQILGAIRRAGGDVQFSDLFVVHAGSEHSLAARRRKHRRDFHLLHLEYQDEPEHPFTRFNLGMTLADAGRYRWAARWLQRCLDVSQPEQSHVRKAYALLVAAQSELEDHAAAWQTCQAGLNLFPKDPELLFRAGILHHGFGRFAEAERAYRAALANDDEPHFASIDQGIVGYKARHNLAALLTDAGELDRAEQEWRAALHEVPDYAPAWQGLVEGQLLRGQFDAARASLAQLAHQPALAPLRLALEALLAEAAGDPQSALHMLRQAAAEHPQEASLAQAHCRLEFQHAPAEQAVAALERLLARWPDDAAAWHNLGTLHLRRGAPAAACTALGRSLALRPEAPLTWLLSAYAHRDAGEAAQAATACNSCLASQPSPGIAAEAARLCDSLRRPLGARQQSQG